MKDKELKEMYQKMKKEETPDFWDKIENRLKEVPLKQKKNISKWIIPCSTLVAVILIFLVESPLASMVEKNQKEIVNPNTNKIEITNRQTEDLLNENSKEIEKQENNEQKENSIIDNSKDIETDSVSQDVIEKNTLDAGEESIKKDRDNVLCEIIGNLKKKGIELQIVSREKIKKLEEIKVQNISNELKSVTEEFEKLKKTPTYFKDLEGIYYVDINEKLYKIII